MYSNNRDAYRQTFFDAWQKYQEKKPLASIEVYLIDVILMHPEYHSLFKKLSNQDFALEENPFMHMSLHLALREQLKINRPSGIITIYEELAKYIPDKHELEHRMMTCLAEIMWEAQQTGIMPNEEDYLERLKGVVVSHKALFE